MSAPLPPLLRAYGAATTLLSPLAPLWLQWRVGRGREDVQRLAERYGVAVRRRPPGELVWAHGASIGEALALLPLIEALVARGLKVLVTSGTRSSAAILARRLPSGARHQYLPLDVPRFMRRFLDHWKPRLALFAESEIWPNAILALQARGIPLVLVNARLSPRSAERWSRRPEIARALMGRLTLCIPQSDADAQRFAGLGAPVTAPAGNLKYDLPPPPADPALVEQLAGRIAGRELWMAASTHPGEEAAICAAHAAVAAGRANLLTVVAPRHPDTADAYVAAARARGLDAVKRSDGAGPDEANDLYVVDTIGELGLFFRLSPLVFMGGSLVPHGGQNPFEPARLGAAVLHGPHVFNFVPVYEALDRRGGAIQLDDGPMLAGAVRDLLADAALLRDMGRTAAETVRALGGARERTMAALAPYLPPPTGAADALW